MKKILIVFTICSLFLVFNLSANADCQGCCSWHGGVCCVDGVTMCCDGTPLSAKCWAKGCNKCYGYRPLITPFGYAESETCWAETENIQDVEIEHYLSSVNKGT